jgi:hypothetical protein
VSVPHRYASQLARVLHVLKEGDNVADLLDESRRQAGPIVALDEPPHSTVDDVADFHAGT